MTYEEFAELSDKIMYFMDLKKASEIDAERESKKKTQQYPTG